MILTSRKAEVDRLHKALSLIAISAQVLDGIDDDLRAAQAMLSLGIVNQALVELHKTRDVLAAVIDALENNDI